MRALEGPPLLTEFFKQATKNILLACKQKIGRCLLKWNM